MEFKLESKKRVWKTLNLKDIRHANPNELNKLPKMVREVLKSHLKVLEVSIALPPSRLIDHLIALIDERKLVNVPSSLLECKFLTG